MNQEYFEKDLEVIKKHNDDRMINFLKFIQDIDVGRKKVEIEIINKKENEIWLKNKEKIRQWTIDYDEEFKDIDIDICLLNDRNCYSIAEVIDENINQISENEYIIDFEDTIIKVKVD